MRIVSLRAENVKRLRAVEIRPDGNTVVVAGRNAQGKSSVLDAIWMALAVPLSAESEAWLLEQLGKPATGLVIAQPGDMPR